MRLTATSPFVVSVLIHAGLGVAIAPWATSRAAPRAADLVPIELVSVPLAPPVTPAPPPPPKIERPRPVTPRAPIVPPRLVSRPVLAPDASPPPPAVAAPVPPPPPEPVAAPEPRPSTHAVASAATAPAPGATGGIGRGEGPAGGVAGLATGGAGIPLPAGGGGGGHGPVTASFGEGNGAGLTSFARPMGGYQRRPAYPESARRAGVEGVSTLRFLVREDGSVASIAVERSAGFAELDRAAMAAVQTWRFEPARRGSQAVAVWVTVPVRFELKGR